MRKATYQKLFPLLTEWDFMGFAATSTMRTVAHFVRSKVRW